MPLLQELSAHSSSFDIAILAATISILLGGILFGVGLGFNARRLRLAGQEEIAQGIISCAMVGAIFSFSVFLDSATASLTPQSGLPSCPSVQNPAGSPYSFCLCHLESLSSAYLQLGNSLSRSSSISGFASSLRISAGAVSAQPFFALESASVSLAAQSQQAYYIHALSFMEFQLLDTIRTGALAVFLPAGLLLRTFFATRKIGAAAMAIAVAAYAFYPLLFLYSFSASKAGEEALRASAESGQFNSQFASIPLLDLDQTSSVRDKMNELSEGDFGSKIQPLFAFSSRAVSLAQTDLVVYPLLSLAVTIVAALQLYSLFSFQIFLPYFDAI